MFQVNRSENRLLRLEERRFADLKHRKRDHLQEWLVQMEEYADSVPTGLARLAFGGVRRTLRMRCRGRERIRRFDDGLGLAAKDELEELDVRAREARRPRDATEALAGSVGPRLPGGRVLLAEGLLTSRCRPGGLIH